MTLTIPSAVYAHVTEAATPPSPVANKTLVKFILDSSPNMAPTKTPDAINGIQTKAISPQNPHRLIKSRFSFAIYSTVDRALPMNFVCSIFPPKPSCFAIATTLSSSDLLFSILPAPDLSARVET